MAHLPRSNFVPLVPPSKGLPTKAKCNKIRENMGYRPASLTLYICLLFLIFIESVAMGLEIFMYMYI